MNAPLSLAELAQANVNGNDQAMQPLDQIKAGAADIDALYALVTSIIPPTDDLIVLATLRGAMRKVQKTLEQP